MQRLGQHFLKNPGVLKKIMDSIGAEDGTPIIEIGPGHGELTGLLVETTKKHGAKIIAIEKDEALAEGLSKRFSAEDTTLEIIPGDALKVLPRMVASFGKKKFKIAGNIPYYITGKLLRIISELEHKPERVVMLIQKEVAERICAEAPDMNRLAASVQFWADPAIVAIVSKQDFSPPPKVDSAVIILNTKPLLVEISTEQYYAGVRAIFAQPRKTILNNVADGILKKSGSSNSKASISRKLVGIGIIPEGRPQNLTVRDISAIAKTFF